MSRKITCGIYLIFSANLHMSTSMQCVIRVLIQVTTRTFILTNQIEKSVNVTKIAVLKKLISHGLIAALPKTYSYTYAIHSYFNKVKRQKVKMY
jgi:hypothetical protein